MPRKYAGTASAATGTDKSILTLISAATIRPELYEMMFGSVATPADQAADFVLMRFTAVGTEGSGFTPVALDPGDPASLADYGCGVFSVEPTYTANSILWAQPINQRASWRWLADDGCAIKAPATAANGLGLKSATSTSTQSTRVTMHHME